MLNPSIRLVGYKCWRRTYHRGGHANGLGVSFMILITGFQFQEENAPRWRLATADAWRVSVVPHVLFDSLPDRCDLSVAWGKNTSPLWHSHPAHTYKTCTPPWKHSAVCSLFPVLTFSFCCFTFSQLCGDYSCCLSPPSLHPSSETARWHYPSPITHHICWLLSHNKDS